MPIDHRSVQTAVRDQGNRPTCVGFAVSAAHEWMAADEVIRSPEDAMWAGHKKGGQPTVPETSVRLALEGLADFAHATEEAWPYGTPEWPADRPLEATLKKNRRELPAWRLLGTVAIDRIRRELVAGHAVVLTLGFVRSAWYSGSGRVDAPPGSKRNGNHAVLAVGAIADGSGGEEVIIKNSWGNEWGQDGYGFATQRYIDEYGVRAHVLERP